MARAVSALRPEEEPAWHSVPEALPGWSFPRGTGLSAARFVRSLLQPGSERLRQAAQNEGPVVMGTLAISLPAKEDNPTTKDQERRLNTKPLACSQHELFLGKRRTEISFCSSTAGLFALKIRFGANTHSSLSRRAAKASFTGESVTGHGAITDVLR